MESKPDIDMNIAGRCYACFRPAEACFCATIPTIENQTEVLILQHRRERRHPFNTARIVNRALRNSQLLADHIPNLAARLRLKPKAGVLFPASPATLISELPEAERPEQLIVLDGTWHHAKTLMRDIPALQSLPRYRLAPPEPSRYRIRREPNAMSLSTVEAAVSALQILEPETRGFDRLLAAFDTMVERQLAHPRTANRPGLVKRRRRCVKNIPRILAERFENLVVAYGESPGGSRGRDLPPGPPVTWAAQRLGTGETFSCTLTPQHPLDEVLLGHLRLTRADFTGAISHDEARRHWAAFQRPGDIVVVFYPGTARLFRFLADEDAACLALKSIDLAALALSHDLDRHSPAAELLFAVGQLGRTSQRLASTITVTRELCLLASQHQQQLAALA